jgi:hypothetical protein
VLDEYGILIQALCMLARMSAAAANSTALGSSIIKTASPKPSTAHGRLEAAMVRLSLSDARQLQ